MKTRSRSDTALVVLVRQTLTSEAITNYGIQHLGLEVGVIVREGQWRAMLIYQAARSRIMDGLAINVNAKRDAAASLPVMDERPNSKTTPRTVKDCLKLGLIEDNKLAADDEFTDDADR